MAVNTGHFTIYMVLFIGFFNRHTQGEAMSDIQKALDHTLVKNAIEDMVKAMALGGARVNASRQIITEFATEALKLSLSERVSSQKAGDMRSWKAAWADASLAIFVKKGGSQLTQTYVTKLSAAGYYHDNAHDQLTTLATAISGIGQMIMQGVNPMMLFNG